MALVSTTHVVVATNAASHAVGTSGSVGRDCVVEHLAFVTTFTLEGEAAERGGSTLAKMSQHLPPSRIDPMLCLIGREELGEHTL